MAASTNRMSRNKDRDLLLFRLSPSAPPPSHKRKDHKSTINSSGRERMAVLDQHIKFFEGNYSVTAAVSCERQT